MKGSRYRKVSAIQAIPTHNGWILNGIKEFVAPFEELFAARYNLKDNNQS